MADNNPNVIKRFIEACGRHPFATGLFAILGVIGLLFSIYAFAVDRAESEETSDGQRAIAGDIADVGEKVANIPGAVPEADDFVPLESSYDENYFNPDNVTFAQSRLNEALEMIERGPRGEIENYQRMIATMKSYPQSTAQYPFIQFSVSSLAARKFVQIAPYLVIDVRDVTPMGQVAMLDFGERGAAAQIRHFSGAVPPVRGFHYAPLIDSYSGEYRNDVDFFTVEPGEVEEFFLDYGVAPGYYYDLRIGLHYKYDGKHRVHWVTETFSTGIPEGEIPVIGFAGDAAVQSYAGAFWSLSHVREQATSNRNRVSESGLFNPTHIE